MDNEREKGIGTTAVPSLRGDRARATEMFHNASQLLTDGHFGPAVRVARRAAKLMMDGAEGALGLGGILIDSGSGAGKMGWVREGISLLENALPNAPSSQVISFRYNIGTGYSVLGDYERGRGPLTRPSLRPAIEHLAAAAGIDQNLPEIRVNLANALRKQGRAIEALDVLNDVLYVAPEHHQALASRAECLIETHNWLRRHGGSLQAALSDYRRACEIAERSGASDYARSYLDAAENLSALVDEPDPLVVPPSRIEEWIWNNALAINACPLCRIETPHAFDVYAVDGVMREDNRHPSHVEILEIINSWHRSFSTARWQVLEAVGVAGRVPDDHVVILSALPDATRGVPIGLLASAFTGFHAMLDQIAFGLNIILGLHHPENVVSFSRLWAPVGWKRGKRPIIPEHRAELHPGIRRASAPGLSALYHLAWSFENGDGMYKPLRTLRNTLEHKVAVVTHSGCQPEYATPHLVLIGKEELLRQTIAMGRLAKAALLYAGGAIWWSESERRRRALRHDVLDRLTDERTVERE